MARTTDPERVAARRAEILEAAAVEFALRGSDGARATDIAARAGVSSGTVFYYFGDKAALFRALFAADGPRNTELAAQARSIDDPMDAVLHLVDGLTAEASDPEASMFVVELVRRVTFDAELAAIVTQTGEIATSALEEAIARGVAGGQVDPSIDAARAAGLVSAMIDGLYLGAEPGLDRRPELRRAVTAYLSTPDLTQELT